MRFLRFFNRGRLYVFFRVGDNRFWLIIPGLTFCHINTLRDIILLIFLLFCLLLIAFVLLLNISVTFLMLFPSFFHKHIQRKIRIFKLFSGFSFVSLFEFKKVSSLFSFLFKLLEFFFCFFSLFLRIFYLLFILIFLTVWIWHV